MSRQYCSQAMASVHETAEGLHNAGLLDKQTMRQFVAACLTPVRPLKSAPCANEKEPDECSARLAPGHRALDPRPVAATNGFER